MKLINTLLVLLVFLANLVFAQPSFADRPKFTKSPEYIEVTKALDSLLAVKDTEGQAADYNPEEIQKRIDELEFQKYTLEAGINWGQCSNETGKTIAVYGPKPDVDDYSYQNALYFLADGQTTKNKWDCDGVYIPSDIRATNLSSGGQGQDLGGGIAVKIPNGTKLVMRTNPDTGAVEFNTPAIKVLKTGEVNWFIPNISQALIDTRVADAPTAKS